MKLLITGGTGYIGSHTVVELLNSGHDVVMVDNLSNSSAIAAKRIEAICHKSPEFINLDVTDHEGLSKVFKSHSFDAVIHFAALKAVSESITHALDYYQNNIVGLLNVIACMQEYNVPNIIFSSSATVYGTPETVPLTEKSRVGIGITNPYGQTKMMCEQILTDCAIADPKLQVSLLRYFNPAGAHESGLIGEDPNDTPNNLMPIISRVAIGKLEKLNIYGSDYDTPDGTGVRDYIHVVDLAKGHLAALSHTPTAGSPDIYNLGTGIGYSVLDIVKAFQKASGIKIPYTLTNRRPGDVASCYADASKAAADLNWRAEKTLTDMCEDFWRWQKQNPNGYEQEK